MDCHFLLQGIFLTQGSNPCFLHPLHWQAGFFFFFTTNATWEALYIYWLVKKFIRVSHTLSWKNPSELSANPVHTKIDCGHLWGARTIKMLLPSFYSWCFSHLKKILFIFIFLAAPHGMWDPSSPTRDQTRVPALEGRFSTTGPPGKSLLHF